MDGSRYKVIANALLWFACAAGVIAAALSYSARPTSWASPWQIAWFCVLGLLPYVETIPWAVLRTTVYVIALAGLPILATGLPLAFASWRFLPLPTRAIYISGAAAIPICLLLTYLPHRRRATRSATIVFAFGAAVLALAASLPSLFAPLRSGVWYRSQPIQTMLLPASADIIRVVAFVDYLCPFCRTAHARLDPVIREAVNQHPSRVVFERRDFPLASACNPELTVSLHPFACEATALVRAAAKVGKGQAVEDYLYEHQNIRSPDTMVSIATEFGVMSEYRAELERIPTTVEADIKLGVAAGVHATPTYFVNGIAIAGSDVNMLRDVLSYAISR